MKTKNHVIKTIVATALLASMHFYSNAQTWSTTGNAGTNQQTNFIGTTDNRGFTIRTNNTKRVLVDSVGRVAIGTLNPYANLHAIGTNPGTAGITTSRFEAFGGTSGSNTALLAYSQGGSTSTGISTSALTSTGQTGYGIYASASGAGTNWAGYFSGRIYVSDKIGIGTTGPNAKVHINTADTTTYALRVQTNSTTRMLIYGNGNTYFLNNVMIGTAIPAAGYKLSVKGKVMCEELKVELNANWPDYVFTKDYALMPISEVENHIAKFNHLPGIPSASEMKESGLAVGAMQTKLVEKVEELTLYIIQLQKQIDELKSSK